MKRTMECLAVVVLWAASGLARGEPSAQPSAPPIQNFLRISHDFATGGQPPLAELARLKSEGVRAIINLRQPEEHDAAGEIAQAKAVGLRYFNIAVNPAQPKDEQVKAFLALTSAPENRPAFVHCASAGRVGAFWMIRRVIVDGWKLDDAAKEAEKIGLKSPALKQFAVDYIRRAPAHIP